jgi:hypothetical protein
MKRHVHCLGVMAAALLLLLVASRASAQSTARSMDIDPSPISTGMGGASAAAFWTAEPNYWSNPALLGYYQGARWQWGRIRLVPGLASDVIFSTHRYTLGMFGVGFENAGQPISGMGRTFLSYGQSEARDQYGNLTGSFGSYEEVKSWGVGVSLARLIGSLMALGGREAPAILDHVDLAAGMSSKSTTIVLAPAALGGEASGRPTDHGVLLRCGLGSERPRDPGALPLRVDLALGAAITNDNDVVFDFGAIGSSPPTRTRRLSAAVYQGLGLPQSVRDREHSPLATFLLDGLEPMVSFGLIYENERLSAGNTSDHVSTVDHFGIELTAIRVLSLRAGYVSDVLGNIVDPTWGIGIALPIGDVAGARFDYAQYPQARGSGLKPVSPRSFSAFADPIAISRRLWGRPQPD